MRVYEVVGEPFQKSDEEGWFLPCEVMLEGDDTFRVENIKFPAGEQQALAFAEFVDGLPDQIERHVEMLTTELEHFTEMLENKPYVVLTEDTGEDDEDGGLKVVH